MNSSEKGVTEPEQNMNQVYTIDSKPKSLDIKNIMISFLYVTNPIMYVLNEYFIT